MWCIFLVRDWEGGGAGRTYNNHVGVLRFYIGIGFAGFASTANKVQPVH